MGKRIHYRAVRNTAKERIIERECRKLEDRQQRERERKSRLGR